MQDLTQLNMVQLKSLFSSDANMVAFFDTSTGDAAELSWCLDLVLTELLRRDGSDDYVRSNLPHWDPLRKASFLCVGADSAWLHKFAKAHLESPHAMVRSMALRRVARRDGNALLGMLRAAMGDDAELVRGVAAGLLAEYYSGDTIELQALEKAVRQDSSLVQTWFDDAVAMD